MGISPTQSRRAIRQRDAYGANGHRLPSEGAASTACRLWGDCLVWQSWPIVLCCKRGAPMPTRNVSLTKDLDQFIAAKVEAGLYANASEVMRTALRLLERDEREYEEKMTALRNAIAEGDAGDSMDGEEFFRSEER